MNQGWFGTGVLATARTSCWFLISSSSNLLAKVDSFAFISMSSRSEYMPPLELATGLILSASLGLGSSHALDVSAT